jgi:alpha-L-fucosidase
MSTETNKKNLKGNQRLSIEQLQKWESLKYGMFIHFGMSTFDLEELSKGDKPATYYNPDKLDVDQWVRVARDAGMKYAVLTTKHVAGHCLWPSAHTDYHVGNSGNTTDVLEAFVKACDKYEIMPGFYYCSWDNHHLKGSLTPTYTSWPQIFTTREYQDFQTAQIKEILSQYGKIGEVWIDIPSILPRCYRTELYADIVKLQPEALVMMNNGISDGSTYPVETAWPADLIAIERFLPNSHTGHVKWRKIDGKDYYMPGEVCDPIGKEWFYQEDDVPRSDAELLGMYLTSVSRGTNLLLDVGPDKHGLIPKKMIDALMRLRKNIDQFES